MQSVKLLILVTWIFLFMLVGIAPTEADQKNPAPKELYKQNCRVCHEKDSPNGEYSPMTLIQDQWKKFFTAKFAPTHRELTLPGQNQKLLESLTPEQLKAIQKYCVDHAADSEKPQSCT